VTEEKMLNAMKIRKNLMLKSGMKQYSRFMNMQCAGQYRRGRGFLIKMLHIGFCFMHDNFAYFVLLDVTLLFGLYAVMVNNCTGVRSNETG
jgi:hypothetical protein